MFNKMKRSVFLVLAMILVPLCAQAAFPIQPKYAGDVHLGYGSSSKMYGTNTYQQRIGIGTIQGVSLNDWIQVGLGVDLNFYTHYYAKGGYMPSEITGLRLSMSEFIDMRGSYPIMENLKVYMDLGLGLTHKVRAAYLDGPVFFCQFGPGVQWKHLDFSLGLQANGTGKGTTTFFAKIGYCF